MDGVDRVIGKHYDADGIFIEDLTIRDVMRNQLSMLQLLYFDYFLHDPCPDIEEFADFCFDSLNTMLVALEDRYVDHIEGIRKDLTKKRERNE